MSIKGLRDRYTRRRADVRNATILSRNADGTYQCRDLLTQHEFRASKANRSDEFTAGTRVVVAPMAAGRISVGGGNVVVSRAPQEQRGVGLFPRGAIAQYTSAVILSIDPSPIRLSQGGASVAASIYGKNLTTAPTYGHAEITDNTAPVVVSSDQITIDIQASASAPLGFHSLTCHGVEFSEAIEVTDPPTGILWLTGYVRDNSAGSPYTGVMYRVDVDSWAVTNIYTSDTDTTLKTMSEPVVAGDYVHSVRSYSAGGNLYRVKATIAAPGTSDGDIVTGLTGASLYQIAVNGTDDVAINSRLTTLGLYTYPEDSASPTFTLKRTLTGTITGVIFDGTYYWVGGRSGTNSRRVAADGASETALTSVYGYYPHDDSTYVWIADGAAAGNLYRVTKSGLASTSLAFGATKIPLGKMQTYNGSLYCPFYISGGGSWIARIDPVGLTVEEELQISSASAPAWTALNGATMYCAINGNSPSVITVDLASFTVTSSTAPSGLYDIGSSFGGGTVTVAPVQALAIE